MNGEFERLGTMIQDLRKENAALKQQNYDLEMKLKNFSQFDEKVLHNTYSEPYPEHLNRQTEQAACRKRGGTFRTEN